MPPDPGSRRDRLCREKPRLDGPSTLAPTKLRNRGQLSSDCFSVFGLNPQRNTGASCRRSKGRELAIRERSAIVRRASASPVNYSPTQREMSGVLAIIMSQHAYLVRTSPVSAATRSNSIACR